VSQTGQFVEIQFNQDYAKKHYTRTMDAESTREIRHEFEQPSDRESKDIPPRLEDFRFIQTNFNALMKKILAYFEFNELRTRLPVSYGITRQRK